MTPRGWKGPNWPEFVPEGRGGDQSADLILAGNWLVELGEIVERR